MLDIFSDLRLDTIVIVVLAGIALAGVAVGVLIQTAIANFRKQKQPIGRRVDTFPTFKDPLGPSSHRNQITLSDGEKNYKYEEVQLVQLHVSNQGDKDFEDFKFGITLSQGDVAIYIESQSPDRQHQVEQLTPLTFGEPKSEIDFVLRPFQKTETYSFRLLVVTSEINKDPGEIEFSSPESVRFVALPTLVEIAEEAARSASVGFGPFSISLGK
ncbi:hypothetical protein [Microcoleus sp. FACHB-672]|uniref:hypothetical protein n=1 Tax=Microcoleus sp. FACHB-672 TaxID=2692825 RepID=UPI0018EFCB10|nr:hypothetical protein [Microcoleus sp. FACHB-672]